MVSLNIKFNVLFFTINILFFFIKTLNKIIKFHFIKKLNGDDIGLTQDPLSLRRFTIVVPELASIYEEFENSDHILVENLNFKIFALYE